MRRITFLLISLFLLIGCKDRGMTLIKFKQGTYHYYSSEAFIRDYYISNHDQVTPKKIAIPIDGLEDIILDGNGSHLIMHNQIIPISIVNSKNIKLRNFTIDYDNPHIIQAKVLENDTTNRFIIFETAPWVQYVIKDSLFYGVGEDWEYHPTIASVFEGDTKRVLYNSSDISLHINRVEEISKGVIKANGWFDKRLLPGTVMAMRTYYRPNPGIFISGSKDITIENVTVHYAEGMGLLAQMSENITLNNFSVALKGATDPRYFTTQADATHFSGCKGVIISQNGLYEGMMDDAINVHGTYLKIVKRVDDRSVVGRYMHPQSYGFLWGEAGDTVNFIRSNTMDIVGDNYIIESINPYDIERVWGAKEFLVTFTTGIDTCINENVGFGMENLSWTPEVYFKNNIIRNNRARGALFSTPKKVVVQRNVFDHTSGTGILLCGDCNGWYETGSCRDITIRRNVFINALTSYYQFTNAVISIYPVIPDLENQQSYFHGRGPKSIRIEKNTFKTFDHPILYAKSVNGLIFKGNYIEKNNDYPPFHWNKERVLLERVINDDIEK